LLIQAAQQRGQGSVQQVGGPGAQPDLLPMVSEIRESLNSVRRDLTNSYARQAQQGGGAAKDCPAPAACVTGTTVALLLGGQLILLLGYLMYRDSREASAKKFY
jgi:mannose-binding lectin 1